MKRGLPVVAALLAAALADVATAQSTARIIGTVVDTSGVALADAEVVANGNRRARTDSAGQFQLAGLSSGTIELRVRRLGYIAQEKEVRTRASETTNVRFVLERRPVLLDTIAVTADCLRFRFSGFACRRRTGKGVYIDQNAIDSINPRFPADVFRGQSGFRVDAGPRGLVVVPTSGWRCATTLVNGRPPNPANPRPTWPNEILGVEIYARPEDVPPEYGHYMWQGIKRCSVVIYWTQLPPRGRSRSTSFRTL